MLEVIACDHPERKREHFSRMNPKEVTWVVSDLQSKWHLQREWLSKYGLLDQTSVLRASELWRKLALQIRPRIKWLSLELAQILIWKRIEEKNLPWLKSPASVRTVLKQMEMWVSVFANPDYKSVMSEWFTANSESFTRWGHWFLLCSELWEEMCEKDWLLTQWTPGLLLSEGSERLVWNKKLVFDLGPQISQAEGQLIRELGRRFDVQVLYPDAPWLALMPQTLQPYADMVDRPDQIVSQWEPQKNERWSFGRFSTQLAEVKDAVAQVRIWLEEGVQPEKIGIVAPDIETHWPALRLYFEREGIPVNKAVTAKMGSFVDLAHWTAAVRTRLRKAQANDLEIYFYSNVDKPRLAVSEFRRLFTHFYDERDLARGEHLFTSEDGEIPATLGVREFLAWALKYWQGPATERLDTLLGLMAQEVPPDLSLPVEEWLTYVEGVIARREVTLAPPADNGVACVSLSSAHWLPLTHVVLVNLSESALRNVERSPVSPAEASRIFYDTGMALGSVDRQQLEFELIWFWQKPHEQLRLTFAETDFQGAVNSASRFWMWAAIQNEKLKRGPEAPRLTRWDEWQRMPFSRWLELMDLEESDRANLTHAINRDVNGNGSWPAQNGVSISASSLSAFWECPFVFAMEKRLGFRDEPALDLDVDHFSRGRLLHALLEVLGSEPVRFDWRDDEILDLLEKSREREKIEIGEEKLWPAVKAQHLRLARKFLEFERDWRTKFPNTKNVGHEIPFEIFWDVKTGEPVKEKRPVRLRGRIDRIDQDSKGRYAVIDYKSGATKLTSWGSWLKNHQIQLPLYAWLLERGLLNLPSGPVVAANYFVVRDQDRNRGFYLRDESAELYDPKEKRRNYIETAEKEELFAQMGENINSALNAILSGRLDPVPEDPKICEKCHWRRQCRAPHLN